VDPRAAVQRAAKSLFFINSKIRRPQKKKPACGAGSE
jgi:hypothetical protein